MRVLAVAATVPRHKLMAEHEASMLQTLVLIAVPAVDTA
jgi:hypothetical protein